MKYSPKLYAQALIAAKGNKVISNFLDLLRRNRDEKKLPQIITEAENLLLLKSGKRKVIIESARPLNDNQKKLLQKILKPGDVLEEKISPELIAGVKITINGELQFDGTLARKLKKMFA